MKEQIINIIKVIKNGVEIGESDHFILGGILSSLELLQLIAELEEKYSVKIPVEEVLPENFDTVEGIEAMIGRLKA